MWNFATPDETEERLRNAGFEDVRCWLEDKPIQPEHPREFTTTVTLGPHLARLPEERSAAFAEAVLERSGEPLVLDYVRLNIDARRPSERGHRIVLLPGDGIGPEIGAAAERASTRSASSRSPST